ncbi:hypothetical protein DWB77_07068 [Streptomyces hundungensis]|uniref:Uncharacterized protein n=1 Tax=Streptomyces hundungensis TaxID=1077946 RepID=A0A387HQB2_9ACTN|nr:hypothetical protein [Streptomyces hundungensis]AYG84853.1 hypothetical protein DWB77_07068 [Streptomyces hundungensis]
MNGIELVLRAVHHGEHHLAGHLTAVAERHRAEHEVHHVATDLAAWSHEHVRLLSEAAKTRGLDLDGPPDPSSAGLLMTPGRTGAPEVKEPGLLLLRDLCELHLNATRNSLYWEMLAQAAQAGKDGELLELASSCHPQTLRQLRWSNSLIKVLSPQTLTSL